MKKSELIELVKNRAHVTGMAGVSAAQCDRIIQALCEVIKDEVSRGGDVRLPGLGSFRAVHVAERPGRNPATGEEITIAAKTRVAFNAAESFRVAVNR